MRILLLLLAATSLAFGGIAATGTGSGSSSGTTNPVIQFSGMSLTSYCVVVVSGGHPRRAGTSYGPVSGSGYTQASIDTSVDIAGGVWYKRMGLDPDDSVVCYAGDNGSDGNAYVAIGLTGVDSTVLDAAVTKTAGWATPDPPSVTTATDSAWVLASGVCNNYDTTLGTITNYTNDISIAGPEYSTQITVALATREIATAGAENPGAWSTWDTQYSVAFSTAIRPGVYEGASPGAISVTTTPVGAAIWLDGVNTDSVTPCTIGSLSVGDKVLKLTLPRYRDFIDTLTFVANDTVVVNETLSANTFTIRHAPMMLMTP